MSDILPFPRRIGVTMLRYGPVITEPHGLTELSPSRRNYVLEDAASADPATDKALVERVARAICDEWGYLWDGDPDEDYQVAPENNRGYDERPSKELFRSAARAAIRAMEKKP